MVSTIEQNSYCILPDSNVLFVWISKGTWAVKLRFYTNGHKMAMITGIQLLLLLFCDLISSCSLLEQHTHLFNGPLSGTARVSWSSKVRNCRTKLYPEMDVFVCNTTDASVPGWV